MGKLSYTKAQLEQLIFKQLENLDAHCENIRLLKEQNELLLKVNHMLIEALSEERKKPVIYPVSKVKRPKSSETQ